MENKTGLKGVDEPLPGSHGIVERKKSGRPPSKSNVKKIPVKKENLPEDQASYCPCDVYIPEEISIKCDNCSLYWHICCVGLSGLNEEMVNCLTKWDCPNCFFSPHSSKGMTVASSPGKNKGDCGTMKLILKEELQLIQPVIRATVEDAVRRTLPVVESSCSKKDVEAVVKTYADAAKQSQKSVIEDVTKAQFSQIVIEKFVRKLDSDKLEREKRKCNVVVLNVPESKMASSGQKHADDMKFCREELGMPSNDIETCWRAGKIDSEKPDYCRPLIIKMIDVETADDWTKNGKGYKTESGFWINKDLCDADRKANFLARQERRARMKQTPAESTNP